MTIVTTDMKVFIGSAKRISYTGTVPNSSTLEGALNTLQAEVTAAGINLPAITPTPVNFAMSPYAVSPNDYLLEVDTSGGAVVIVPQAPAARARKPLGIKDVTGNADANPIAVNVAIDGLNPYPVIGKYAGVTIRPNAAQNAYEVTTW
jgi:hypothetical protein